MPVCELRFPVPYVTAMKQFREPWLKDANSNAFWKKRFSRPLDNDSFRRSVSRELLDRAPD